MSIFSILHHEVVVTVRDVSGMTAGEDILRDTSQTGEDQHFPDSFTTSGDRERETDEGSSKALV